MFARRCKSWGSVFWSRRLYEGIDDSVEDFINKQLVKNREGTSTGLTSTRREALALYRDVLRASRIFVWPDKNGVMWRDVLRASARNEFEAARFEKDPELIARLLVVGKDAVQASLDKQNNRSPWSENRKNDRASALALPEYLLKVSLKRLMKLYSKMKYEICTALLKFMSFQTRVFTSSGIAFDVL